MLISPPQRNEFFFLEQPHGDRRALPGRGVLDDDEPGGGNPAAGTTLDGQLLRGKLHHIGPICLGVEATLEFGEYKDPVWSPVGPIDLREQSEWPRRTEKAFGEFDLGTLQFLWQPRALAKTVRLSAAYDPQGGSQRSANDCQEQSRGAHRIRCSTYLAVTSAGRSKSLASHRADGRGAM